MTKFVPYPDNPYKRPEHFRLVPENDDDASYYKLFIKNMVAALAFQVMGRDLAGQVKIYDQEYIYRKYQGGDLKMVDFDGEHISPVESFMGWELSVLKEFNTPEALKYKDFLWRSEKIFRSIDRSVNFEFLKRDFTEFQMYIYPTLGMVQSVNLKDIHLNFLIIEDILVRAIKKQLIDNMKVDKLIDPRFDDYLFNLSHHLNNDLLDIELRNGLKSLSVNYFNQMVREVLFIIGLKNNQGELNQLKEHYAQAIGYTVPKTIEEPIDYPRHIFTKPEAYLLFHDLASKLTKKSPISFLYRRMAEKDNLIHVRDTEFRDWFQSCGYPAELHSTTETYVRAHTEEREVFLELLYKKYNLP